MFRFPRCRVVKWMWAYMCLCMGEGCVYALGVLSICVNGDQHHVCTFRFWCVFIMYIAPPSRMFIHTSHGGYVINGCGSRVGDLHVVGTPGAGGAYPMLLCYLEGSYPCYIGAALSILCAMWGWLCASMTGQHLMFGVYPSCCCARCSDVCR